MSEDGTDFRNLNKELQEAITPVKDPSQVKSLVQSECQLNDRPIFFLNMNQTFIFNLRNIKCYRIGLKMNKKN